MDNRKIDDKRISELVRAVKFQIPASVEERVDETLEKAALKEAGDRQARKSRQRRFSRLWYPMPAMAMLVIIAGLFIIHTFIRMDPETSRPSGASLLKGDKVVLGSPIKEPKDGRKDLHRDSSPRGGALKSVPLKDTAVHRQPVRGVVPTGALLGSASSSPEPVTAISEIRTEFEIKDKNIKILWVQKRDFALNLKD